MLMIGFPGTSIGDDDPVLDEIRKGKVGGIIFFEKNIAPQRSMFTMKDMIYKMQAEAYIPLLIAIDQAHATQFCERLYQLRLERTVLLFSDTQRFTIVIFGFDVIRQFFVGRGATQ